jgi:hypothetical protein
VADCCEHGNGTSHSVKGGEFDLLSDYYFLKENSSPWVG